jgi:predicted DNA-binding protein
MTKTTNSITLRFYDPRTIDRLDAAAQNLNMSRSAYIRRCVVRGLEHTEEHELPLLRHREIRRALAQAQ